MRTTIQELIRREDDRREAFRGENLIARIQAALGTEETGEALVEVARNAHKAEMELAAKLLEDDDKAMERDLNEP